MGDGAVELVQPNRDERLPDTVRDGFQPTLQSGLRDDSADGYQHLLGEGICGAQLALSLADRRARQAVRELEHLAVRPMFVEQIRDLAIESVHGARVEPSQPALFRRQLADAGRDVLRLGLRGGEVVQHVAQLLAHRTGSTEPDSNKGRQRGGELPGQQRAEVGECLDHRVSGSRGGARLDPSGERA